MAITKLTSDHLISGLPRNHEPYKVVSTNGVPVEIIDGKIYVNKEALTKTIIAEIEKMPKETHSIILAAEDASEKVNALASDFSNDMAQFRASVKSYIEDIRQTRFSVVNEVSQMTNALKDVRQFFLGSDYKEQVARLREFIELCERLQQLKASGFLDTVADTMLRLAERK